MLLHGLRFCGLGLEFFVSLSKARSKSSGFSDASTSRAISTKRLWRSASVSLGKRFDDVSFVMPHDVASSNGNSSWRGSAAILAGRRHEGGRLGRLRWPLATSCLISETLALDALQREIAARRVVNAKLDPVRITEVEFAQIPLQMSL
jgi:hypothetical protein